MLLPTPGRELVHATVDDVAPRRDTHRTDTDMTTSGFSAIGSIYYVARAENVMRITRVAAGSTSRSAYRS